MHSLVDPTHTPDRTTDTQTFVNPFERVLLILWFLSSRFIVTYTTNQDKKNYTIGRENLLQSHWTRTNLCGKESIWPDHFWLILDSWIITQVAQKLTHGVQVTGINSWV